MTQAPPTHIPRVPQPIGTQVHSQPISFHVVNTVNTKPTSIPVVISQAPTPKTQDYSLPPPMYSALHSTSTPFTLLNPWQMQAKAEQAIPHSGKLHPKLNLESDAARIRNNINKLEDLNMYKNKGNKGKTLFFLRVPLMPELAIGK